MTEQLNGVAVKRDARDGYHAVACKAVLLGRRSLVITTGHGWWDRPCPVCRLRAALP
jgi:hypothetical protein